jgi:hypothetical protein
MASANQTRLKISLLLALLAISFPKTMWAAFNRLYFAAQYDWGSNTGFYLSLEGEAPEGVPCKLSGAKVALGVADGHQWRYIIHGRNWQLDHNYTLKAVVHPQSFELSIDGELAGQSGGSLSARNDLNLNASLVPSWASSPAEYLPIQKNLSLETSDGKKLDLNFDKPLPLILLTSQSSASVVWQNKQDQTLTITAQFRVITTPDPRDLAPFVDRYGQSKYGDWPGKVNTDADLTAATQLEKQRLDTWGIPGGFDAFGGVQQSPWKDPATGFFHLAQHDSFWWLITPEGNPCFYIGLSDAPALNWDRTPVTGRAWMFEELPPKTAPWDFAWGLNSWGQSDGTVDVALHTVNMIRKYGEGWKDQATAQTVQRMRSWGFSGFGKWSSDAGGLPIVPVLNTYGVPILDRHPDIFNPTVQAQLQSVLAAQINPRLLDPLIVGWSLNNEYDDIITGEETKNMLNLSSTTPAKKALADEALKSLYSSDLSALAAAWKIKASTISDLYASTPTPPAVDIEALRQFFARQYYDFIYRTIKRLDPNHLYFGFWIVPGWWVNETDWELIAPYCDIIGYDRYNPVFADAWMNTLIRRTNKPVFLGEFSFPPTYNLERGFRAYTAANAVDDADAGRLYFQWVEEARRNPYCVGVSWFQYRDEPVSGRGPGQGSDLVYGEDFAFGLVDVTDQPKYDLVEWVRLANLHAAQRRLAVDRAIYSRPLLAPNRTRP